MVLYVDDILLVSSEIGLLCKSKRFFYQEFLKWKILWTLLMYWAYIYIKITLEVFLDYHKRFILKMFLIDSAWKVVHQKIPLMLRETNSVLINALKIKWNCTRRKQILYALAVGSLIYAQVYTCSDIAFIVGLLGRYLSNPWHRSLENNQTNYALFVKNKISHAHLSVIRLFRDH